MTREIQIDPIRVRTMQIVVFALIAGIVAFLVVALVLTMGKPAGEPFLAYFAAAFAGIMIIARFIVPRIVAVTQLRQMTAALSPENEDDQQAIVDLSAGAFQTKTIIENALLEGAAFFNLVVYIQVVQTWSLAVVSLLVAIMLLSFPSEGKVVAWVAQQLDAREFEK